MPFFLGFPAVLAFLGVPPSPAALRFLLGEAVEVAASEPARLLVGLTPFLMAASILLIALEVTVLKDASRTLGSYWAAAVFQSTCEEKARGQLG